jgi:hypothetical protein
MWVCQNEIMNSRRFSLWVRCCNYESIANPFATYKGVCQKPLFLSPQVYYDRQDLSIEGFISAAATGTVSLSALDDILRLFLHPWIAGTLARCVFSTYEITNPCSAVYLITQTAFKALICIRTICLIFSVLGVAIHIFSVSN